MSAEHPINCTYRFPVSFDEVFECDGGGDSVGQLDAAIVQEIQQ